MGKAIDMGSLVLIDSRRLQNGDFLEKYEGKAADMPGKLPHHASLATGSTAMAVDDGDVYYKYEKTDDVWILQD